MGCVVAGKHCESNVRDRWPGWVATDVSVETNVKTHGYVSFDLAIFGGDLLDREHAANMPVEFL